jgi:transcription initiation factor TFIID subunit 11
VLTVLFSILVDAFNPIQSARYDLFKRAKLRKETLRRIVNHALSQSVPASVVTTINGFTKVFAGEIIEKARTVQQEWAEAFDQAARAQFEAEEAEVEAAAAAAEAGRSSSSEMKEEKDKDTANGVVKHESPDGGTASGTTTAPTSTIPANIPPALSPSPNPVDHHSPYSHSSNATTAVPALPNLNAAPGQSPSSSGARPKREFKPPPNPHRGQLLPSHLREALRRYKRDGEGGGVGVSGLSLASLGVRGAYTWNIGTGGRRLFR